jgi:hypothetical protein
MLYIQLSLGCIPLQNFPEQSIIQPSSSHIIKYQISAPFLAALPRRIYLDKPSLILLPAKSSNIKYPPLSWLHYPAEFT